MAQKKTRLISRRDFMKVAGVAGTLAAAPTIFLTRRAKAAPRTLKILQWSHFVPGFDKWFNETYIKEWGGKNNTEVIVDNIGLATINARAAAEASAQKGHDLFMFLWPAPVFEKQVIDHREVVEECERRYGKMIPLATKSTYNPRTKKYYGFSDSYVPDPVNYRKDLWDDIGMFPNTWEDVRVGGRKIKEKSGNPVGIGLSAELDTSMAMRAIMYSWGSYEQDEKRRVVINSKQTLEAVKFVRALYKETMTPEVFTWDASSNNRFMLAGKGSLALNAISITRTAEKEFPEMSKKIWVAKTPAGPVARIGLEHVMDVYVIWKFAENIEGAKQFLVDYIGNFEKAFMASEFYNFPCFPNTVPNLKKLIANDPKADPPDKYKVLEDVLDWATNVGHPGYANAAIDEVYSKWIIPTMFAKAARDELTPEEAIRQAEREMKRIFAKWAEAK